MLLLVLAPALFVTNQAAQPAAPDNVTRAGAVLTALAARESATIEAQFTDKMKDRFMAGTGKSLPAEYFVPSHVAEDVIRDLAEFIKR